MHRERGEFGGPSARLRLPLSPRLASQRSRSRNNSVNRRTILMSITFDVKSLQRHELGVRHFAARRVAIAVLFHVRSREFHHLAGEKPGEAMLVAWTDVLLHSRL